MHATLFEDLGAIEQELCRRNQLLTAYKRENIASAKNIEQLKAENVTLRQKITDLHLNIKKLQNSLNTTVVLFNEQSQISARNLELEQRCNELTKAKKGTELKAKAQLAVLKERIHEEKQCRENCMAALKKETNYYKEDCFQQLKQKDCVIENLKSIAKEAQGAFQEKQLALEVANKQIEAQQLKIQEFEQQLFKAKLEYEAQLLKITTSSK